MLRRWSRHRHGHRADLIRAITYLVPGLPLGLFEHIGRAVSACADEPVVLCVDQRSSGPPAGEPHPFRAGAADLGFMCAPSYLALAGRPEPDIELLGIAPVFDDPRAAGAPVYFADVIVRNDTTFSDVSQLLGRRIGYNDRASLSGLLGLRMHLASNGLDASRTIFVETGSHDRSLGAVAAGDVDGATIDSNTLRLRARAGDPTVSRVRVLATLGPFPIQPIVVRRALDPRRRRAIRAACDLVACRDDVLSDYGCVGFADVCHADYDALTERLRRLTDWAGPSA